MGRLRLVIEANPDDAYPWCVSEVDEDGVTVGSASPAYETVEAAMASAPDVRWSERVPARWWPDVVRVGPWYDDDRLPA